MMSGSYKGSRGGDAIARMIFDASGIRQKSKAPVKRSSSVIGSTPRRSKRKPKRS